jgi:hypothetical protein
MVINLHQFFHTETAILSKFYFRETFANSMFIFRGAHVGQQHPYEDSFTTSQITPENHGSLLGSL